jgi:hypothetical protein
MNYELGMAWKRAAVTCFKLSPQQLLTARDKNQDTSQMENWDQNPELENTKPRCNTLCARIAQSLWRIATGLTFRGSNPGGGEIFRIRPDRPWGPPSLLYKDYRVFPGVKRPRRGVDHPPPSSAEVKERVELCFFSSFGLSWSVRG